MSFIFDFENILQSIHIKNMSEKLGWYSSAVQWVTERAKPNLHARTDKFIENAIEKHGEGNPKFEEIIRFEVKRRGYGAGLTQDVGEPVVATVVNTTYAIGVATVAKSLGEEQKSFKSIGYLAALTIAANQAFNLIRALPRFTAGLQGSLEMATDRIKSIKETGIDPFSKQQAAKEPVTVTPETPDYLPVEKQFSAHLQARDPNTISPTSLMDRASQKEAAVATR